METTAVLPWLPSAGFHFSLHYRIFFHTTTNDSSEIEIRPWSSPAPDSPVASQTPEFLLWPKGPTWSAQCPPQLESLRLSHSAPAALTLHIPVSELLHLQHPVPRMFLSKILTCCLFIRMDCQMSQRLHLTTPFKISTVPLSLHFHRLAHLLLDILHVCLSLALECGHAHCRFVYRCVCVPYISAWQTVSAH